MRKGFTGGFTVLELMIVICIAGVIASLWTPRAARVIDWLKTQHALRDMTTALALARHAAILHATRARLTIESDTLRIDRLDAGGWTPWWRRAGPADHGVGLEVSNPVVVFGPTGMGWGAANTKIVLRRGSHLETITVSRVGRVRVW